MNKQGGLAMRIGYFGYLSGADWSFDIGYGGVTVGFSLSVDFQYF